MIDDPLDWTPDIVTAQPRYQREPHPLAAVFEGRGVPLPPHPVWNLDGVPWQDAPAPRRDGHRHRPHTVVVLDVLTYGARCACSASWYRGSWGYPSPHDIRFAEPEPEPEPESGHRVPPGGWLPRLLHRAWRRWAS